MFCHLEFIRLYQLPRSFKMHCVDGVHHNTYVYVRPGKSNVVSQYFHS
jgi:hypothetical protein